jgi:hypothetical protein
MAIKLKTAPAVSTPARKLVIAAKPSKAKAAAPVVAAPVPEVKATGGKSASVPRFIHPVKDLYDGASPTTNSGKSRTPWKNDQFGTQPDRSLTPRTEAGAKALRDVYGANPFKRGNVDSGVANVLIQKGYLQPLTGAGTSEEDTYKFTPPALAIKLAGA